VLLQPSGSGIEKRGQLRPAELRSDPKDNASDGETSKASQSKRDRKLQDITGQKERHTQMTDDSDSKNIRREMQGVGSRA